MPSPFAGFINASHFSPDIADFIRLLDKHCVRYVIVGGEAVIYHGYARFTGDVDFYYSNRLTNVQRLWTALKEFWGGNVPVIESAEELTEPGIIVQFGRPPNRIDLLNRIDGVRFAAAWKSKLVLRLMDSAAGIPLFMLDLENLIRNKRSAGRPKDLDDLKYLEKMVARKSK